MKVTKILKSEIDETGKEFQERFTAVLKNTDKNSDLKYVVLKSDDSFDFNSGDVFTLAFSKPDQKTLKQIEEREAKEKEKVAK